jgi:hypothetical protein
MAPFVDDVGHLLQQYAKAGKRIVFEGAHAVLLDIDHGTYPYVTSSSCSALGLYTGSGAPPQTVQNFYGIMKAYSTRVGGGPFPTEQNNDTGNYIRERGNEYGTTTRRPRRCGWFDAMAVKYSVDLCGVTHVALTLLDVLSGLDHIQICTGYKMPASASTTFVPTWTRWPKSSRSTRRSRLARQHQRLSSLGRASEGSADVREAVGDAGRRADQDGERRSRAVGDDHALIKRGSSVFHEPRHRHRRDADRRTRDDVRDEHRQRHQRDPRAQRNHPALAFPEDEVARPDRAEEKTE